MKRIAKPQQATSLTGIIARNIEVPLAKDISIDRLIEDGLVTLHREMKNILILSANGKLEAADAKDLRDHLKLLFELKDQENKLLKDITDEELEIEVRKRLGKDANEEQDKPTD